MFVFAGLRPPLPPNFNVDCSLLGDDCQKINTLFRSGPNNDEATLKFGGRGAAMKRGRTTKSKGVLFFSAPEWDFGSRPPTPSNAHNMLNFVEPDLKSPFARRPSMARNPERKAKAHKQQEIRAARSSRQGAQDVIPKPLTARGSNSKVLTTRTRFRM